MNWKSYLRTETGSIGINLELNQHKTVFLTDSKKLKDIHQIEGISRVDSAKYFGFDISIDLKERRRSRAGS